MKEISIIGATFYGNRGAEGMLSTTIGKLRERYGHDLHFNVFTYYPMRDAILVDDPKVSVYSSTPKYLVTVLLPCALICKILCFLRLRRLVGFLPRSVPALARSSVLICLAGVSFVEGRTKFIPFNIATILPAMLLGVPVVKFAQAMGPFNALANRLTAQLSLGRCHQIFTRGEKTHSYVQKLLSDHGKYQRADDVAFLFKREYCVSDGAKEFEQQLTEFLSHRKPGKIIVGICPSVVIAKRGQADGWNYLQRMCELVNRLVDSDYTVVIYPNATRGEDMDKAHNNDLPLLESILGGLGLNVRKHVVCFSGSLNAKQIHQIVNACDVHAVSRFHAMVAALASSIPVMVLGWSHKYLEVMERFSQQDMVLDYKKGSVEPLIVCINQLVSERSERSATIASALPDVQNLALKQVDYVVDLLKNSA